MIVDIIDDENEKTKVFGITGEEAGKWRSMSKEEVEQIVYFDDDGNPIPLDKGEEIVDFADIVKE